MNEFEVSAAEFEGKSMVAYFQEQKLQKKDFTLKYF